MSPDLRDALRGARVAEERLMLSGLVIYLRSTGAALSGEGVICLPADSPAKLLEALTAVDEAKLRVWWEDAEGAVTRTGLIVLVFGNGGADLIADYTLSVEDLILPLYDALDEGRPLPATAGEATPAAPLTPAEAGARDAKVASPAIPPEHWAALRRWFAGEANLHPLPSEAFCDWLDAQGYGPGPSGFEGDDDRDDYWTAFWATLETLDPEG